MDVQKYLLKHRELADRLDIPSIHRAISLIVAKFEASSSIYICGNGGSALTASHCVADWNKMTNLATGRPFRGYSLCDNVGLLTAFANDIAYEDVFAGQLRNLLRPEDLVIAISGSGQSRNVLKAIAYANDHGADTLALVGYDGGALMRLAKHTVHVPVNDMQLCEDVHLMFCHMVMRALQSCQTERTRS